MRHIAAALLLAAGACGEGPGNLGPGGGGIPPGGSGSVDGGGPDATGPIGDGGAPPADAQIGEGIFGRLCEASSLLAPDACPPTSRFAGVIVANASNGDFVTADAGGAFELPAAPALARAVLRAAPDDPVFRRALVPVGLVGGEIGPLEVPVVPEADWITLTNTVGASNVDFDAAVFVYVVDRDGSDQVVPLAGALASVFEGDVYYDDGAPLEWRASDLAGTGAAGVVWVNAIRPPLSQLDITITHGDRSVMLRDVPVEPDAVTFVTADFGG